MYLHFADIDSLTLAVAYHLFDELIRRQDQITESDPRQRVLAGALVYCEFGLASPGHYQLMFATPAAAARVHTGALSRRSRSSS